MAMDFFDSQENARRRTGRLVILLILAVIAIIIAAYLVVAGAIVGFGDGQLDGLWAPELLFWVGLGVLLVVSGGSLYKLAQLRGGGRVIAEHLGGRPIQLGTTDPVERKVLNVVDEMAIASGTPAPPVYMMADERGINAFAAGYEPGDAVIGVTRGAAERLSRDELQGVIAHEFSHVLNGDMRLNIRLIGILHGILIIGIIGYFVFRMALYSGAAGRRYGSSRSGRGGNPLPLLAIGAGLAAVGFIGTFFGSMIKAAVSRQREYLADAAAVQFTRNPEGIGGALKKIGGFKTGSRIDSPNAAEASHMFFGRGLRSGFNSIFSTHPPLPDRIRRIDPSWDGEFEASSPAAEARPTGRVAAGTAGFAGERPEPSAAPLPAGAPAATAEPPPSAFDRIGQPTREHLAYARQLVDALPEPLAEAAHDPYGARAVIFALLINSEPGPRRKQLDRLAEHAHPGVCEQTRKLLDCIDQLEPRARLPLIDMAIPTLRQLSAEQYEVFRGNVDALIKADDRVTLFEWTLRRILAHHLDPEFRKVKRPRPHYYALDRFKGHCEVLLSTLAHAGNADRHEARAAFEAGTRELTLTGMRMCSPGECGLGPLGEALDVLVRIAPRLKRRVLRAAAVTVAASGRVTIHEAELLRGIADTLDCPMPPLLPGQPLV